MKLPESNKITSQEFLQNSSLTVRLKRMMIAVALFFLLLSFGVFISSRNFFKGLAQVSSTNTLFDTSTQIYESILSADESAQKVLLTKDWKNIQYAYAVSMKEAREKTHFALSQVNDPAIHHHLSSALTAINLYGETISAILKSPQNKPERIKQDLLIAGQFQMDAREAIRKVQISAKKQGDLAFSEVYRTRHLPVVVSVILSLLFFSFVLIEGLVVTGRLDRSIQNLLNATEKVGRGSLTTQAPIFAQDEIGRLTHAFNKMVFSLYESQRQLNLTLDRIARLQNMSAEFSKAPHPEQLIEITVNQGSAALNATAAMILLPNQEETFLEIKQIKGYSEETLKRWGSIPIEMNLPVTDAFRERKSIFIESVADMKNYPNIRHEYRGQVTGLIPLEIGDKALGVFVLTFGEGHRFTQSEKDFMIATAQLCAQALQRATLYQNVQKALDIRNEFLSIASHELRTPLTPLKLHIQSMARLLKQNDATALTPERIEKLLRVSDQQLNRLSRLVDDLLDVSRIETGKLTLNLEPIELVELLNEVLARYQDQMQNAHSPTSFTHNGKVSGMFDRIRLEQVIINLLTNASKYAPGQPIEIDLSTKGQNAVIRVKDHGPGIAKEDHERIFKRFERVKDQNNISGLGLGLYISRQIVEAHSGLLKVDSDLGRGSEFILQLPLNLKETT